MAVLPLAEVVDDPEAKGHAITLQGEASLQIHEFPDEFTAVWPLDPRRLESASMVVDAFSKLLPAYHFPPRGEVPDLFVQVVRRSDRPGGSFDAAQAFVPAIEGLKTFAAAATQRLADDWSRAISLYLVASLNGKSLVALWSDTVATPSAIREIGVTAKYGAVRVEAIRELAQRTLPTEMLFSAAVSEIDVELGRLDGLIA